MLSQQLPRLPRSGIVIGGPRELQRREFVVPRFDCARWSDGMMFGDLKAGLGLPAYTGSGFGALADSLTDIDVPGPTGVMVALDNFNTLEEGDMLLRVLSAASPLGREVEARPGAIQALTPMCDALFVPDIDASLDDEDAKRDFWHAFRSLGDWYSDLPPY